MKKGFLNPSERQRSVRAAGGRLSFRFGVMSDEFIGRARYSEKRWPYGNLGGNADDFRPLGDGSFFVRRSPCAPKLGGTARREARPMWTLLFFVCKERKRYETRTQFQCRPLRPAACGLGGNSRRDPRLERDGHEHSGSEPPRKGFPKFIGGNESPAPLAPPAHEGSGHRLCPRRRLDAISDGSGEFFETSRRLHRHGRLGGKGQRRRDVFRRKLRRGIGKKGKLRHDSGHIFASARHGLFTHHVEQHNLWHRVASISGNGRPARLRYEQRHSLAGDCRRPFRPPLGGAPEKSGHRGLCPCRPSPRFLGNGARRHSDIFAI